MLRRGNGDCERHRNGDQGLSPRRRTPNNKAKQGAYERPNGEAQRDVLRESAERGGSEYVADTAAEYTAGTANDGNKFW